MSQQDNLGGSQPNAARLLGSLGDLEAAIMEVVWNQGPATVREVLDHLQRTPLPAYTTVLTVMTRLADKGLLGRTRAGKGDVYSATLPRDEYERRITEAAVRGLVAEYGDVALAQFAQALAQADPEHLSRLRARLAQGETTAWQERPAQSRPGDSPPPRGS